LSTFFREVINTESTQAIPFIDLTSSMKSERPTILGHVAVEIIS
jgi:hypothetical protein